MLPVRVIGGPGRRYRQREQERTREKRTVRSRRNAREKRGNLPRDNTERICQPLPGSPCQCRRAWRENTYRNRPIRPLMRMMTGTMFSLFRQP
jgi:hypothetical protein